MGHKQTLDPHQLKGYVTGTKDTGRVPAKPKGAVPKEKWGL